VLFGYEPCQRGVVEWPFSVVGEKEVILGPLRLHQSLVSLSVRERLADRFAVGRFRP
jgi:hypothetical protein